VRTKKRAASGVTLLELIVTVALLGTLAAIALLAFPADRSLPSTDPKVQIARARATALHRGSPVSISVMLNGRPVDAYALPDGSVITDTTFHLDRLGGR
jgi:prepilin-type N-terminal cleavage/methylation domain-containing protein